LKHETLWAVYEANVQAYRGSFNSAQSILLAFGAIIYDKNTWLFILIALLAVMQIWYIWFRVIRARILIVDYHKIFVDPKYRIPETDITEKIYVEDECARRAFNEAAGMNTNWRLSRFKMDILLPILYTSLWCAMFISILPIKLCVV
jgi:hypothetical protein